MENKEKSGGFSGKEREAGVRQGLLAALRFCFGRRQRDPRLQRMERFEGELFDLYLRFMERHETELLLRAQRASTRRFLRRSMPSLVQQEFERNMERLPDDLLQEQFRVLRAAYTFDRVANAGENIRWLLRTKDNK